MLKGTTKIELTNVYTGETQVIEKHNNPTGALQELFNPVLGHLTDPAKLYSNIPVHTSLLGGLLLFNSTMGTEDEHLPLYAPETAKLVGCARFNTASTQGSTYLGSYDTNESVIDTQNKMVKFVYNFTQSQANGTINSVCLTHINGGLGVYRGDYGFKSFNTKLVNSIYSSPPIKLVRGNRDRTFQLSVNSTGEYLYAVDIDNDVAHYFKITAANTLVILKRRMCLKQYSLFGNNDAIIGNEITIPLTTPFYIGSNNYGAYGFDSETQTLNIISVMSGASSPNVSAGAQFSVTSYKIDETSASQVIITNRHTSSVNIQGAYVYRGKVFTPEPYTTTTVNGENASICTIVSHTLADGTCATHGTINALYQSNTTPRPQYAADGRIYWQTAYVSAKGIGGMWVTDCSDTASTPATTMGGIDSFDLAGNTTSSYAISCTPVIGHPMLVYMSNGSTTSTEGFYFLSHYLGTINNLSTPIEKGNTQTMKITYTITET